MKFINMFWFTWVIRSQVPLYDVVSFCAVVKKPAHTHIYIIYIYLNGVTVSTHLGRPLGDSKSADTFCLPEPELPESNGTCMRPMSHVTAFKHPLQSKESRTNASPGAHKRKPKGTLQGCFIPNTTSSHELPWCQEKADPPARHDALHT